MGYYASAGDWYFGDPGRVASTLRGRGGRVGPIPRRGGPRVKGKAGRLGGKGGFRRLGRSLAPFAQQLQGPFGVGGLAGRRRYRRINVLNPRALRRALRRAVGFERFARRVVRLTSSGKRRVKGFRFPKRRRK